MESLGFEGLAGWIGARLDDGGKRQGPYLAIGEDSVDIEENKANPAGALSSRKVHGTILPYGPSGNGRGNSGFRRARVGHPRSQTAPALARWFALIQL